MDTIEDDIKNKIRITLVENQNRFVVPMMKGIPMDESWFRTKAALDRLVAASCLTSIMQSAHCLMRLDGAVTPHHLLDGAHHVSKEMGFEMDHTNECKS